MIAYGLMGVVALLAMIWLMRPWWRSATDASLARRGINIAAYRTRLRELDEELSTGLIDADTAQALRDELGARLVSDVEAEGESPAVLTAAAKSRWPWGLALALPLLAALGYYVADSWQVQRTLDQIAADPASERQLTMEAMVRNLEKKLQTQPDDAEGWAMLGRSYFALARYSSAAEAYHKANQLSESSDAEMLVGEGESLAMANERRLLGAPEALFEKALTLDAGHGRALWYAGLIAIQKQDYARGMQLWTRLRGQELPTDMALMVDQRLQELSQLSGLPLPDAAPAAAGNNGVSLRLRVQLSPKLQAQLPTDGTLLVFAKAAQGPPMPLAVQKLKPYRLPLEVVLDDRLAMMPELKLSAFSEWIVTARITQGDDVRAQPGDLQGQIVLKRSQAGERHVLVISERVGANPL